MSRSGYVDDYDDPLELGRWRGAVRSALRGKRGQAFLKEMLAALDALPEKRLCRDELEIDVTGMPFRLKGGDVCAIGSVGRARGIDMSDIDPYDRETIAAKFGIPFTMACEIMNENDEYSREMPEDRYVRVRKWVEAQIIRDQAGST